MPTPLALSAFALAASAYLRARYILDADVLWLRIAIRATLQFALRERDGRFSFFYVLERWAMAEDPATASRPCLHIDGRTYTFAQVYDRALRWGHWLRTKHSVRERDVVPLDFGNCATFVWLWMGLWAIGAKPAFINCNLTGAPLSHSVRALGVPIAFVEEGLAGNFTEEVRGALEGVRVVVVTPEVEAEAMGAEPVRQPDEVRYQDKRSDMAILIYTSGTTGLPKPAVVSWAKVLVGGLMISCGAEMTKDDVYYTCMPLYHSSAAILCLTAALSAGASSAIGARFSTKTFWRDVRRYDATLVQYVGEVCRYLLVAPAEYDPATGACLDRAHRVRVACGNGLRPDVWDRFKERFGIPAVFEFYSATEAAGGTWNRSRNAFGRGAIGRFGPVSRAVMNARSAVVPLDFETEAPVRDPATGFALRSRAGEPGELLFKLDAGEEEKGFQGYYGRGSATATAKKILRDVFERGDVWFRSGDMVVWDDEWRLFFSDRLGDTFRWKSENVSTAEVAQTLGMHPAVREANVYGVEVPHHDGRAGCVAIVLDKEPAADVLRSLAEHAQDQLPRYAVPLFLRLEKEVGAQMTATIKHVKTHLRQQGVDPRNVDGERLFWLKDGTYVPFTGKEWKALEQGQVKL